VPGASRIRCVVRRLRAVTMIDVRGDRVDASAHPVGGPASPGLRTLGLVAGSVLAVAATVVVFLTDDPRVLRLAVVAAAWGFVLAALVASRRSAEGTAAGVDERAAAEREAVERAAAEREAELRLAHELELEREVAGRREHELRVENELRRAAEQSMRTELAALRAELAALRQDLTGLAELRTDVGRLRTELADQLSGEMLVERVLLRTQSSRIAPEPPAPRTVEVDGWTSPAAEPTAALPAGRTMASGETGTRRHRTDVPAPTAAAAPDEPLTAERPSPRGPRPPVPVPTPAVPTPSVPTAEAPVPTGEDPGRRPGDLPAESGPTPPSDGRRRRRYREDDEIDDVLARVLGRS
jgi:hypothetical protein